MRIIFSFDDNEKLNMKIADLFDKYRFKATFFINPTARPQNTPMTRDDIINLSLRGFEIGAHTMTHQKLTLFPHDRVYWEIKASQEYLEELLKEGVVGFCYPKGSHTEQIERMVERCNYWYARAVGEGCTEIYAWDWYKIIPTVQIYNKPYRRFLRVKENILTAKNGFAWNGDWKESCMKFIKAKKYIVHIWGHALEIEQQGLWYDLEGLLRWIRNNGYEVADGIRGLKECPSPR